jgi:hypothetical protein
MHRRDQKYVLVESPEDERPLGKPRRRWTGLKWLLKK